MNDHSAESLASGSNKSAESLAVGSNKSAESLAVGSVFSGFGCVAGRQDVSTCTATSSLARAR